MISISRERKAALRSLGLTFAAALVTALVLAAPLYAAGGGEGGGEAAHGNPIWDWFWKIANFAILVFILVKFLGPGLREYLQKRSESIEKTLEEARAAREAAEKALSEVQERMKQKDAEIERIIEQSRTSAQKEREHLVSEGERLSKKLLEQAQANIGFELKEAREQLKAEAAEVAVELAEKKIRDRVTPDVQQKLVEESLEKLEGGN